MGVKLSNLIDRLYSPQYLLGHEDMTVTREYVKIAAQDASDMYRSPLDALSE